MTGYGLMFHHFHSNKEDRQLGSIDEEEFKMIIEYYLKSGYTFNDPHDFIRKVNCYKLTNKDVVITFDDNLLCQYKIAKPILDQYGIKAFWFINTQTLEKGKIDKLELFRHFRNTKFFSMDDFYVDFFGLVETITKKSVQCMLESVNFDVYLSECPFYSYNDKRFKYVRDELLTEEEYSNIMFILMNEKQYRPEEVADFLWMKDENIKRLCAEGHIVGLHSHTHYTSLSKLSYEEQLSEYLINKQILEKICTRPIISMSHPCGEYSADTFEVLKKLEIQIGFLDNMFMDSNNKFLIPREDHSNILQMLKEKNSY